MTKDLTETKLENIISHQQKIIKNYELAGGLVSMLRRIPFMGCVVKLLAIVLGSKTKVSTRVIDNIKNKRPEIIAIVSPDFRGVRSATIEMVPDVIEISNIYSHKKAAELATEVIKYSPKKVLISGYAQGHDMLIEELKKADPSLRIFVLIHSAFIWFDVYPAENYVFERFIKLAKDGIVEKVSCWKKDLGEYFKSQGLSTFFVMNRFYPEKHEFKSIDKDNINIGVFGNNLWHRNITNQVIGALMIKSSKVHVNEISNHFFINKERLDIHGILPKDEFLKLYKKLDLTLYISMTECFPMVAIESMQYGVPCLLSDTSDVYSFSPKLKSWLTVSTIDSPIGISKKIKEVIEKYNNIQKEIKDYLPVLKNAVERSIEEFLK